MRNPPGVVFGVVLLVAGLLGALRPYAIAKVGEQVDAIGSQRSWHAVEPADWKVTFTRHGGLAAAAFGAVVLIVNL